MGEYVVPPMAAPTPHGAFIGVDAKGKLESEKRIQPKVRPARMGRQITKSLSEQFEPSGHHAPGHCSSGSAVPERQHSWCIGCVTVKTRHDFGISAKASA
jgi:hypothetical protein